MIHRTFFHQISREPRTCDSLKAYCMGSWKMCHCMCVKTVVSARWCTTSFFTCGQRSSGATIWATMDKSWWPIAWPARSPDLILLDYYLWGHMKPLIYETPLASKEDLLARVMAAADFGGPGLVIVCTRTWYGGIVSVVTSVVVTSSPTCKWSQTTSSCSSKKEQRVLWYFTFSGKTVRYRTGVPISNVSILVPTTNPQSL